MKALKTLCCGLVLAGLPAIAQEQKAPTPITALSWTDATPVVFTGKHESQQLVISAQDGQSHPRDVTHDATYLVQPEGIVHIEESGFVRPLANGTATITADFGGVTSAPRNVSVSGFSSGSDLVR